MILRDAFASEEKAREFAANRLRDVPAIEVIEIWEGETRFVRMDRSADHFPRGPQSLPTPS